MESNDNAERRQHKRTRLQKFVIGILNSDEIVTAGLISDISLGGVNFTHEITSKNSMNFFYSIDLISESIYLDNIPCECAWKFKEQKESCFNLIELEHCGIQFSQLTSNQIFLLRNFINHFSTLKIKM